MKHLLNFPMIIESINDFEIGQRVLIPEKNHTGRYIGRDSLGDNIVYKDKDGNPRLLTIGNNTIWNKSIDRKSQEYRVYNKILGKIEHDSK